MAGASHTAHLNTKHTHKCEIKKIFTSLHSPILHTNSDFRKWIFFFCTTKSLPANKRFDALSSDGSHGHRHGFRCGQPVRVVVAGSEVAYVVDVAEHEGHSAESAQTAASCAC